MKPHHPNPPQLIDLQPVAHRLHHSSAASPRQRFTGCDDSSSSTSSSNSNANNEPLDSPSLILPYLYVGDQDQTQIDTISSLNISYILSLQSLPKFLSNDEDSLQKSGTNRPPVARSASIDPKLLDPQCSGSENSENNNNNNTNSSHHAARITLAFGGSSGNRQSVTSNSSCESYDIIDGGDGGLLPSANSSKDYLVKIKPVVPKNSDFIMDADTANPSPTNTASNSASVSSERKGVCPETMSSSCGEYHQIDFTGEPQIARGKRKKHKKICDRLPNNSNRVASNARIDSESDDYKFNNLDADDHYDHDEETNEANDGPSDSNPEPSRLERDDEQPESSASGPLLGCSLKQRCTKISSSVHRLIRGKCINISDTFEQLLDKFFDETHNFIEEARRNRCNVLVHCKAGISRSPTIAIAYLMKWKRLHMQDAYNFVKQCRPQISPNLNFMGQLVSYERQLQRDRSQLISPTSCCLSTPMVVDEVLTTRRIRSVMEAPPTTSTKPAPTRCKRRDSDGPAPTLAAGIFLDDRISKEHETQRYKIQELMP